MRAESRTTPSGLYTFQDECLNLLNGTLEVSKAVSYLVDDQSKPFCFLSPNDIPSGTPASYCTTPSGITSQLAFEPT